MSMFGSVVRHCSLALTTVAASASMAIAQPNSDAERITCESAAKDWAPVRLPAAGVNVAIPCNDDELRAYKNVNEERKRTEGIAGCERAGRTYIVMYLVNTPVGFFDGVTSKWKGSSPQNFQVGGHRVFRAAAQKGGETDGEQLIEIDQGRSILMTLSSKAPHDAGFANLASCFFNTLQVGNR